MLLSIDDLFKNHLVSQNPWHRKSFLYFTGACVVAAVLSLLVFIYERSHPGFDASVLFRDPNALASNPAYYGLFSNIGVLCWAIAATVSLFTGYIMMRKRGYYGFFLLGGCLSAILCFDDLFMIHEYALPHFGIPESFSYVCEGFLLLILLWVYRAYILKGFWLPLFISLAALSFSVLLDSAPPFRGETTIEDTAKLIGIAFWAYYFTSMSLSVMREMIDPSHMHKDDRAEAAISTSGLL